MPPVACPLISQELRLDPRLARDQWIQMVGDIEARIPCFEKSSVAEDRRPGHVRCGIDAMFVGHGGGRLERAASTARLCPFIGHTADEPVFGRDFAD